MAHLGSRGGGGAKERGHRVRPNEDGGCLDTHLFAGLPCGGATGYV